MVVKKNISQVFVALLGFMHNSYELRKKTGQVSLIRTFNLKN